MRRGIGSPSVISNELRNALPDLASQSPWRVPNASGAAANSNSAIIPYHGNVGRSGLFALHIHAMT